MQMSKWFDKYESDVTCSDLYSELNTYGTFWTDMLDRALHQFRLVESLRTKMSAIFTCEGSPNDFEAMKHGCAFVSFNIISGDRAIC